MYEHLFHLQKQMIKSLQTSSRRPLTTLAISHLNKSLEQKKNVALKLKSNGLDIKQSK